MNVDGRTSVKQQFTLAERARVRDALIRYKTEHKFSVSRLTDEICSNDPLGRIMSYKTLERFLARANDTQAMNVSICYEFVKDLPYFHETRKLAELGRSLWYFFVDDRSDQPFWRFEDRRYFDVTFSEANATGNARNAGAELPNETEIAFSTVMIEPVVDQAYLRVTEVIFNPSEEPSSLVYPRYKHEGVAVPVETASLLSIVRDKLTRRPRTAIWTVDHEDDGSIVQLDSVSFFQLPGQEKPATATARLNARPVELTREEADTLFRSFEIVE